MDEIALYIAAERAIDAAVNVDELMAIHDEQRLRMAAARIAGNHDMEKKAFALRTRAEKRLGEMMRVHADDRAAVGRNGSGADPLPTLADLGIGKRLADRARKLDAMPDEQFKSYVQQGQNAVVRAPHNVLKQATRKEDRAARERKLADTILALPDKRYGVLYMDPEWKDEVYSDETGRNKAPTYPTSSLDRLKERDIASITHKDAALWMWSTNQHLDQAIDLGRHYGFAYKTNWVWVKDSIGMGFWNRSWHEPLLFFTRGNPSCPAQGDQWDSILRGPKAQKLHSSKPLIALLMIEAYFPNVPKIEFNCRGKPRPGWDAHGDEVDAEQ